MVIPTLASQASFQPLHSNTGNKMLSDTCDLDFVPSRFTFVNERTAASSDSIPALDFSALTSADPNQRSKAIHHLGKACKEWGFFNLVNHGIPETLIKEMFATTRAFFDLPDAEKKKYEAKTASDPIKCGNLNVVDDASNRTFTLWRDYLRFYVHPEFHCPTKPQELMEIVVDYTEKTGKLYRKLIESVSEDLGLEAHYVNEAFKLDSSFQIFVTNLYPICPQPDQAIGLPEHTDPGLFVFLLHNGVAGLQIQHNGEWFNANSPPNAILVNVADHLEIFSNGRYKSVKHRAVVNDEAERISIVVANGPSMEAIIGPAEPLMEKDGAAFYRSMKYEEYMESLVTKSRHGKPLFDQMKIHDDKRIVN